MNIENFSFSLDELKSINHVIDGLYNEQLSLPDYMSSFMSSLREQIYFDKSDFMFFTFDGQTNQYEMQNFFPVQWTNEEIDHYVRTYMHIDDVLPILSRKEPIAFRNNDLFSKAERQKTRYYKEFVEAAQLELSIDANIPLSNDKNVVAILGLFRNVDRKEFTAKDLEIIKIYQKHLSNSLNKQLSKSVNANNNELFSSFDHFESLAVVILDSNQNIQSYNTTFRTYALLSSDSLHESDLGVRVRAMSAELVKTAQHKVGPVSLESDGKTYLVEVTKYTENKHIGVVYSLSDFFVKRLTILKDKYHLSNREFEVLFLMLKKGLTNEAISETLFISVGTVKRHLSSAYQKMSIKNQKQLLNLLKIL